MSSDIDHIWPGGIPRVGQVAERSRTVTAKDIERFTEISGDRNPLHYDEAVAKASRFGEIVVQGGVTSAILNAVVAEDLPGPGTVFLQVNWSFKAPVRPGDTITGRAEVLEVRTDKPITKLKTSVIRDDGTLVLDGDAVCYTMPIARGENREPDSLPQSQSPLAGFRIASKGAHRIELPVRPCVVGSATSFMTNDDGLTWLSDRCSFCPSGLWHQPSPSDCRRAPQCRRPTRTECQTARSASSSYSGV